MKAQQVNANKKSTGLFSLANLVLWALFAANLLFIIICYSNLPEWKVGGVIYINSFSFLIWTVVLFFAALITSYSKNYLVGFKFRRSFILNCLGFTLSVISLVMANHILLFLGCWVFMGVFMANLIGVNKDWPEAKAAASYAQKFFLLGSFCLGVGLLILSWYTKQYTIVKISEQVEDLPLFAKIGAALALILAAIIQSAIFPFQRWLMSVMTSPTPASALMHAGFVNGGGILLAFFSSLLFASNTLTILFVVGGITAVTAQFTKLLQVNVKQKLACSTIAQMGFMIMQCGLGFFNAAVAHLILHGFYKAYLFLSAGEEIKKSEPSSRLKIKIKAAEAFAVLIFGSLGAILFSFLTGKGKSTDSGIILTLVVAITVGQVAYNIFKEKSLTTYQKVFYPTLMFVLGIVLYAGLYNAVTYLMHPLPLTDNPVDISWVHIVFGIVFLIGFFLMKLGVYQKYPWLYLRLINDSQPYHKTIFNSKNN